MCWSGKVLPQGTRGNKGKQTPGAWGWVLLIDGWACKGTPSCCPYYRRPARLVNKTLSCGTPGGGGVVRWDQWSNRPGVFSYQGYPEKMAGFHSFHLPEILLFTPFHVFSLVLVQNQYSRTHIYVSYLFI